MTPALERALARYIESGWLDANRDHFDDYALRGQTRPAYLVLATISMKVPPRSEVQVTARCHRSFRAHEMIITDGTARFNLIDLNQIHFAGRSNHVRTPRTCAHARSALTDLKTTLALTSS